MAEQNEPTAPVENTSENNSANTQQTEVANNQQTETQNANTITLTDEQAKFFSANGGVDKIFEKIKQTISAPKVEQTQTTQPEQNNSAETQPAQPTLNQPQNNEIPKGFISQQEYMVKQYYMGLANEPKYKAISEDITSGKVLDEMQDFGIVTTKDGNINDGMIRKFLDLKVKTVPASSQKDLQPSNAPTAQYTKVEGDITDENTAISVLTQAGHERREDAMKYLREELKKSLK